jgi:hypothetical protein
MWQPETAVEPTPFGLTGRPSEPPQPWCARALNRIAAFFVESQKTAERLTAIER